MPAVVNGANEAAVESFLEGKIGFLDIGRLVLGALENVKREEIKDLNSILSADRTARSYVYEKIREMKK